MIYFSNNARETEKIGRETAKHLRGGETICLYGDLGAGKTTFMHGLMDWYLPGKRILSPTFIIVRHYATGKMPVKSIYHADLYRMENEKEIEGLGLIEFMKQVDAVTVIEWAEKMGNLLPEKRIDIRFEIMDENKRKIEIIKRDEIPNSKYQIPNKFK